MSEIKVGQNRRAFLKAATLAGVTATLACTASSENKNIGEARSSLYKTEPMETVRVAYVGVGSQGTSHVRNLTKIEGAEIVAICDIVEDKVKRSQNICVEAGLPKPEGYFKDENDFRRMCERDDIDLVYTATPWNWHVPVCVEAMKTGKHAATEVPAAVTLEECWELVEVAEQTGKHMVQMENCCYDRTELLILNMARNGLFGELLHARCGYLHDLRGLKLSETSYEKMWRLAHSVTRDGDLYPTHGLGPIAQCMNINRGNQFDYLVSMSSNARGLELFAKEKYGADHKFATQKYALGDVVSTLIKTVQGQTILVSHDTNSPRPYSRDVLVQGTKGIVRKYPEQKIHIEGISEGHGWEELVSYFEKWEHPLWAAMQEKSKGAGHGGMDFIEDYRLIQNIRNGEPMDMDVYDAATWSAVSAISEQSIAANGRPIDFPDFTRGKWKTNPELGIIEL